MPCQFDLQRFRIVRLPEELQKELALPQLICADPEGRPFVEGQNFRQWLIGENACQATTADHYLKSVLSFLTFLWFGSPPLDYTAPAAQIRLRVRDYLREKLSCVVRPHRHGNWMVLATQICSPPSVRLFLVALRHFYEFTRFGGYYTDANPLTWAKRLAMPEREFTPAMPPSSGLTLPEQRGRLPETYFCFVDGEWSPQIIDDPDLPQRLTRAFTYRRDQLLAHILFESGARVGEVLSLTVGDWRQCDLRDRAKATNKGSHGERVKEVWWSSATTQLLHHYINADRQHCDPQHRALADLPDAAPLFITMEGEAYRYPSFYYHWRKACAQAQVQMHPHQARHWFVTMALHLIQSLDPEERREAVRHALITYMSWKNPETIQTYDHHLHVMEFTAIHARLAQLVQMEPQPVSPPPEVISGQGMAISPELLARLRPLLNEDSEVSQ